MKIIVTDMLKEIFCKFPEEKHENSFILLRFLASHLQSHNINAASPAKLQHLTHI
jgi:hypothetical protein